MTGEQLYEKLNALFASNVSDRLDERSEAIRVLDKAIYGGLTAEHAIDKMNQMNNTFDGAKGKLSHAIIGKFWERKFRKQAEYRPLNINKWICD
ncbi:hypothetical protein [Mongoliitalea daihaiensis]|uniref:hypothetical protein n=1 Tax=Mongoliitalea daihaiensis TaxID=2782006 RepID=UPI001F31E38A|nr:hypothetical protein [Mongoliitalea daihaiensis]UJP63964.1 hypothetical protein IPZ59_14190 [Mongoliitalea daihaiensis]